MAPERSVAELGFASTDVAARRRVSGLTRRGLITAVVVVVGASVVVAALHEAGRLNLSGLRFEPGWLALAVVGFVALQLAHAQLWRTLMRLLDSPLDGRPSRAIWCVSAIARYVPTSMLMPTLRITMAKGQGAPRRIVFASLVYEAALSLAGALTIAAWFVVGLPQLAHSSARWLVVAVPLAAVIALSPRIFRPVSDRLLARARRDGLPVMLSERRLLVIVALYAVTFVVGGLALYALAQALHPVAAGDAPTVIAAFAVGFVASMTAFLLPGGLGARELALAAALAPAMPAAAAVSVAVGSRLVQLAIEAVLALVTPALAARGAR